MNHYIRLSFLNIIIDFESYMINHIKLNSYNFDRIFEIYYFNKEFNDFISYLNKKINIILTIHPLNTVLINILLK